MCLLVVCDSGSTPSREELLQGACRNPDGFGFAIMAEGGIISERTMVAEDSIDRFLELRAKYPEGYALWHCRIATHGGKTLDNCHPFQVGGSSQTYLAHNGMLSIPMYEDDERSDTRLFAEEVLPSMGGVSALDDPYRWHIFEKWAVGSKLAILTVDPAAKFNLYIINEKSGEWDAEGVWWSNAYHRPTKTYVSKHSSYPKYDDDYYSTHKWDTKKKCYVPLDTKDLAVSHDPKVVDYTLSPDYGDEFYQTLFTSDDPKAEAWYKDLLCLACDFAFIEADLYNGYCGNCQACIDCGSQSGHCLCWSGSEYKDYSPHHESMQEQQPTTN